MNKKILIFTLIFMLFFVSFVSAKERCDVGETLDALGKALHIYYANPEERDLMEKDLKNLLTFYMGIQAGQMVDCTSEEKNRIGQANTLPDNIPSCTDGTKYGKCSLTKPTYCYAGNLVPRCRICGCPADQWCDITYVYEEKGNKGRWGKCYPGTDVACNIDDDCGTSDYTGDYYCSEGDVNKNYIQYTCLNPGTNSECIQETIHTLIDDCEEGEQCVAGQAECQPTNVICTDSDGGIDYFVKGRLTYGSFTANDNCKRAIIDSEGQSIGYWPVQSCEAGDTCYVNEGYCDENEDYEGKPLGFTNGACPNGCKDGACIMESTPEPEPELECTDSDGGKDYYVYGETRIIVNATSSILSYDTCHRLPDSSEEPTIYTYTGDLTEHWCEEGKVEWEYYTCPNGCKDGACISDVPPEEVPCQENPDCGRDFCLRSSEGNICVMTQYTCQEGVCSSTNIEYVDHYCGGFILQGGLAGSRCVDCGDGICDRTGEDETNCPEDCLESEECPDSISIDGVLCPGEWDSAVTMSFVVNVPEGGTTPATLFVMNDASNLYLALRFERSVVDPGNGLSFEFDNDNDGQAEKGDDVMLFNPSEGVGFVDDFRTNDPPCPTGSGEASCGFKDIDHGGSNDGEGAFLNDGTYSVYEMSHPLNTGDDLHDFSLTAGQTVGVYLSLRMMQQGSNYPEGFGDTYYPGFRNYAQITII